MKERLRIKAHNKSQRKVKDFCLILSSSLIQTVTKWEMISPHKWLHVVHLNETGHDCILNFNIQLSCSISVRYVQSSKLSSWALEQVPVISFQLVFNDCLHSKIQMPFSKCSWSFRYFWELLGQCFQDAPAEHCYLTWRPPFYLHYRNINVNEVDKRHGEVVDKIAPTGSVLCGSAHHSYDQVICWRPPIQCSAQQRKPKNRKMHNVTAMWLMWLQCDSLRVLQSYALRVWDKWN